MRILFISTALALIGCEATPVAPTPTPTPVPEVRSVVGPDGGQLWFEGGALEVPAGALAEEVELVWAPIAEGDASDQWMLGPAGLEFDVPIQVTVPLYPDVGTVGFEWQVGDEVARLAAIRGSGSVTAQVSSSGVAEAIRQDEIVEMLEVRGRLADILFVIDDSCSMAEEQEQLASLVSGLVERLEADEVDYRMAVTTTDTDDAQIMRPVPGSDRRFVSPLDSDPASLLAQMVLAGTNGSFEERGLEAMLAVFDSRFGDVSTDDFLREGAALDVLVVSDEEDQSLIPISEGRDALLQRNGRFHALVGIQGSTCAAITSAGINYAQVANASNGTVTDLCGPFQDAVNDLGVLATGSQMLELEATPDLSTFSVEHSTDPEFDGRFYSFAGPNVLDVRSALPGTLTIRYLPID